ncbi:DUF5118 domain-containing protein, partial [Saccharophagus degradans]
SSMKGNFFGQFLILLVLVSTALVGFSQDKIEKDDKEETEKKDSIKSADSKELNYQKFVKEGNVKKGLFNVYTLKEDYYFEIPDSLMSRDLL